MPNLDDILGSGGGSPSQAPPSGGVGLDATLGGGAPAGGNLDSVLGSSGGTAAPKSGGGGLLGHLKSVAGQVGTIANPLNLVRGLVHMGTDVTKVTDAAPLAAISAIRQHSLAPLENPLGVNQAVQQRSLAPVRQQIPTLTSYATHLANTGWIIPDTGVNESQNVRSLIPGQPAGPGLANSVAGRRIHQEGVLPGIVSTVGDVASIADLGATAGIKLGFGNAADATTAEGLAAKAAKNAEDLGGVKASTINTGDAARAAQQAAQDAGNVSMANEYQSAADNLDRAQAAREAVAQRGSLGQAAENATAKAQTVSKFGNQVANAPAELYTKAIPAVANLLTGGRAGELASSAVEAAKNSSIGSGLRDRSLVKGILQGTRSEGERLSQPVQAATNQINTLFKGAPDAERAAYLAYTGDAANTLRPLAGLPDSEIQATIDANPYLSQEGVSPAAIRKAADFADNPQGGTANLSADEAAKIAQAHGIMEDKIYGPKETRHTTGYLDKEPMNPVKQAQREANVAGQPAPMAVDQLTQRLTAPLDKRLSAIEEEAAGLRQRNLDPQAGQLSTHGERQLAADAATVKSIRRQVEKEEARTARTGAAHEAAGARVEAAGNNRIGSIAGQAREQLEGLRTTAADVKSQALRDQAAQIAEQTNSQAGALQAQGLAGNVDTTQPGWYLSKAGAERARLGNQAEDVQAAGVAEAGAKRAQAEQVEPTKVKGGGKIQAQTNRKVTVANARTGGEAAATERLTAAEAGRQSRAESGARGALAKAEETAGARAERLQSDAAARAFRNDQNRLGTLAERRDDLEAKRATAVAEAPNATSVQAPQVRSVLSHAADLADTLRQRATAAEEAGDTATAAQLHQIADSLPKSAADLTAPTRYIAGGEVPEEQPRTGSGNLRMRSRQATTSEQARQTGLAPLTAEGQQTQVLGDINGRLRNQPHALIQDAVGDTARNVASDPGLTGEALAKDLEKQGYTAWRPEATGGVEHPDRVTPDSPVIPTNVLDKYQKWTTTKDPGFLSKAYDTVNKARILKLLGSAFPAHKLLADLLLAHGVAGVSPLDIAKGALGAARDMRSGDLPADVGAMKAPPENPEASAVSRAANKATSVGMTPMRLIDSAGRDIVYKTLIDRGYSPMTAASVTKDALGDLNSMSPAEKAAGRRIVTYYPWQRHLLDVAGKLVSAHPAGLAETASLAQSDRNAHPGMQAQRGELADFMNPFSSFLLTPSPTAGQSFPDAIAARLQQSLNPAMELGVGSAFGMNLHKGGQVTTPQHPFGSQGATGTLAAQPGNLGGFLLHQLVPQVSQVQDVLGKAKNPAGYIPFRQDTGQPESKNGQITAKNVQAGTTKLDAIARLLGLPHAEGVKAPKTKARKGR